MSTFISYSRADSTFAVKLAKDLKSGGFDVWLDQLDIPTGARWDDEVESALENCTTFMIVLSPESIQSQNVKDEVGYAIDAGKHILPVRIKSGDIPFRLRRFQYVDFTIKPYEKSVREIKSLLASAGERLPSGQFATIDDTPTLKRVPIVREHRALGKGGEGLGADKPRISRGLMIGAAAIAALAIGGFLLGSMALGPREGEAAPTEVAAAEGVSPEPPTAGPTVAATVTASTPTGEPDSFVAKFIKATDLDDWDQFVLGLGMRSQVTVSTSADGLMVNLDDHSLHAYYIYKPMKYDDVIVRMRTENRGQNKYFVSLVCRRDGSKWYESTFTGGGLWQLSEYDGRNQPLTDGGTLAINSGPAINEYEMRCISNEISLRINGQTVGSYSVIRNLFTQGQVGFSVSTEDVYPIDIRVIEFGVSLPPR